MRIHILAVCGTGTASLAGCLAAQGHQVSGSDRNFHPPMGPLLEQAGVETRQGFDPAHLDPEPDLVVIGNAISRDNPEARAVMEREMVTMSDNTNALKPMLVNMAGMNQSMQGMTAIVDDDNTLLGIYTDGDLRRSLDKGIDIHSAAIEDVMSKNCKTAREHDLAAEVVKQMEDFRINGVLVVDQDPDVRFGIRKLLEQTDVTVAAEASFGTEAVARGVASQPDVVCCALEDPPTRYYPHDRSHAERYAEMVPLASALGQRQPGVVLGYATSLDGGIEGVYWHRFSFVAGRGFSITEAEKLVRDFDVRYIWSDEETAGEIAAHFPDGERILSSPHYAVFELWDRQGG